MPQFHSDIVKGVLDLSTFDSHDRAILEGSLADSFNSDNEVGLAALTLAALIDARAKHKPISNIECRVLESFLSPMRQPATANCVALTRAAASPQVETHIQASPAPVLDSKDPYVSSNTENHQEIAIAANLLQEIARTTQSPDKVDLEPVKKLNTHQLATAIKDGSPTEVGLPRDLTSREYQKTYPYGMKQMTKAGWVPGKGLGADGSGISTPLQHTSPDRWSGAGIGHHSPLSSDDERRVYNEEHYKRVNHDWSDCHRTASHNAMQDKPSQKPLGTEKSAPGDHRQSFSKSPRDRDSAERRTGGVPCSINNGLRLVHSQIAATGQGRGRATAQSADTQQITQQAHLWNSQAQTPFSRKSRRDRWPKSGTKDSNMVVRRAAVDGHADPRNNLTQQTGWVNSFEQGLPSHPAERKHSNWPRNGW